MRHTLTTAAPTHVSHDLAASTLRLNGRLLLVAALAALSADLAGYHFAAGPFAGLAGQPLTIGAVEAHGLAALVGLLLLHGAKQQQRRGWHLLALGVHLFLGVCNLLFWPVYARMGAPTVGVVSTVAHALIASAQLAFLALAEGGQPLPVWLRSARAAGLYVRGAAIGTLLLGASAHVAVILLGRAALPRVITPAFELLLTVPMCYVSVAGWLA